MPELIAVAAELQCLYVERHYLIFKLLLGMEEIYVLAIQFFSSVTVHHSPCLVDVVNLTIKVCHYNAIEGLFNSFTMLLEEFLGLFAFGDIPDTLDGPGNVSIAVIERSRNDP